MFILYVIGVACVYDVFDQQFATFFKTFFATPQEGTLAPLVSPRREICNTIIMFARRGSLTALARKIRC